MSGVSLDALVLAPCLAVWGEAVTFMPVAGPPLLVAGVFSEKFKEITFEDGGALTDSRPQLGCRASAFTGNLPQKNDRFLIRGRLWAVEVVEPDGQGHLDMKMRLLDDTQMPLAPAPPAAPPPQ